MVPAYIEQQLTHLCMFQVMLSMFKSQAGKPSKFLSLLLQEALLQVAGSNFWF